MRKWVSYPPCSEDEMLDLPTNVPMTTAHWRFRKLPNGAQISNIAQVKGMIFNHWTRKGLMVFPANPAGPAMRGPN